MTVSRKQIIFFYNTISIRKKEKKKKKEKEKEKEKTNKQTNKLKTRVSFFLK